MTFRGFFNPLPLQFLLIKLILLFPCYKSLTKYFKFSRKMWKVMLSWKQRWLNIVCKITYINVKFLKIFPSTLDVSSFNSYFQTSLTPPYGYLTSFAYLLSLTANISSFLYTKPNLPFFWSSLSQFIKPPITRKIKMSLILSLSLLSKHYSTFSTLSIYLSANSSLPVLSFLD